METLQSDLFEHFLKNKSTTFDSEFFLQRERHPPQNQDEDLSSEVKSSFTDPLFDSHLTKIKLSLESFP